MNIFGKIILGILGIGVVLGVGSVIIKKNIPNRTVIEPVKQPPVQEPVITPVIPVIPNFKDFAKEIKIKLNEKIVFSDGLNVKLKEINDSRCPKDVQCIWQGEISGNFVISLGKLVSSKEIRLGTVNNKSVKSDNYIFSLKDATKDSMTIIVEYKKPIVSTGSCYVGGCSSQICSDNKEMVSTCEWRDQYACYQTAKCERQTDGQCGWTETPKLKACLSK